MKIKRFDKTNEQRLRDMIGLPSEIFPARGIVNEELSCENTIAIPPEHSKNGLCDYKPSGGSSSPNTEVNAESQGVQSEIGSYESSSFFFAEKKNEAKKKRS